MRRFFQNLEVAKEALDPVTVHCDSIMIDYSDTDWGSDLDECKSTSGYAYLLIMVPSLEVARNNLV